MNKELKETRNIEPAQERHKNTLERLKTKFAVFENTVVQKHKESYAQLEQENKMLQMELIKMKTELDRTKVIKIKFVELNYIYRILGTC